MKTPYWVNDAVRQFMSKGYLPEGQSVEARIEAIGAAAEKRLKKLGFADKFVAYMERGFYSLASPVWANFGLERGLPISCNGSFVADKTSAILRKTGEIGMMTKNSAGTSAYLGALRPRGANIRGGGTSEGPVHFAELLDKTVNVISQSNVRRGQCSPYLDVWHPDVMEFLEIREEGHPVQHLSPGLNLDDAYMEKVESRDPDAMALQARIIRKRIETGYPYLIFIDTMNRSRPQVFKDQNLPIYASQLCTEIALPSAEDLSFVCCLMSMNVVQWEQWRATDAVETAIYFLDAVMSEYIEKIEAMDNEDRFFMQDALRMAKLYRPLGLGSLGWHDLFQARNLPFTSEGAKALNIEISKEIDDCSRYATESLAEDYGEPEGMKGYGQRNATRLAIAPTTSSSFILGQVSQSIEPHNSNYYTKNLAKGVFTYRNPALKAVLAGYDRDTEETWDEIADAGGSVQGLDFLSDHEKEVFKTFGEIDQSELIYMAADRQKYIDQAQSLNLMISPDTPPKEINALIFQAWRQGVKSLYYQRGTNAAQLKAREEKVKSKRAEAAKRYAAEMNEECAACEG